MGLLITDLEKRVVVVFLCLILFALFEQSNGVLHVYKVGDNAGWTTIGNVDYKLWADNKTFQRGDIIVFEYNAQFHNVMQVTHAEYRACNVSSSPILTLTTGNDSITITTYGHHFFVCGLPGHCQSGQKVDINVVGAAPPVAFSPSGIPSTVSPSTVPPLPRSYASTLCVRPNMPFGKLGWVILQLVVAFFSRW